MAHTENPFVPRPLEEPGLFGRLRKKPPAGNALVEVNNLLASGILKAAASDVEAVNARYGFDVRERFHSECIDYYRTCLTHYMSDDVLSDECRHQLDHLKSLLSISDDAAASVQSAVLRSRFDNAVIKAFAAPSRSIDRDGLMATGQALGLTDRESEEVYDRHARAVLNQLLDAFIQDQRWSPDEERQFLQMAEVHGITPNFSPGIREELDRYRLYWEIEEGMLPEIAVDITLQRGESAHFGAMVEWFEYRTQTKRINYGGPTARIKIAKGVYYRMGSVNVQRVTEEVMQHIDSGAVYITNKRIIFVGGKKNTNIRINRILGFNIYQNGIDVVKDSGRNPFLAMDQNVDVCGLVLDRILRSQQG
jgi:hypothetical protein